MPLRFDFRKIPSGSTFFWIALTLLFLPANAYWIYTYHPPAVVASVGGRVLSRDAMNPAARAEWAGSEKKAYAAIEREVQDWAFRTHFEKQAQRAGQSMSQYWSENLAPRIQVSEQEVRARYLSAPAADRRPFATVQREIRDALFQEKTRSILAEELKKAYPRNPLTIFVPKPDGYRASDFSLFPVYEPPPAGAAAGWVEAPPSKGPADAPVVLEVYSDFYCPYSRQFAAALGQMKASTAEKLRVVFRHLPLAIHPGADVLAFASACAQEQGKFWPMHDELMKWEGPADEVRLTETAKKIGADPDVFSACLGDGRYQSFVRREMEQAYTRGIRATPTVLFNGRQASGPFTPERFETLVEWFLSSDWTPFPARPGQAAAVPAAPDDRPVSFDPEWIKTLPSQGPSDAAVTLVEFTDYHCPFCQRGAQTLAPLLASLSQPIRFVSAQFPLPMHPHAGTASAAALCAGQQGKYWPYRDQLFGAFWGKQSVDDFKSAAKAVGLDSQRFDACLDSGATLEAVKKDASVGAASGVSGTPTYFVNGRRVVGANGALLKKLIEEAQAASKT